jgi:hypothetical protein
MANFRIPRLVGKTKKAGLTTWYWQPSAALRREGWGATPRRKLRRRNPSDVAKGARELNEKVDGSAALNPAELRRVQRTVTLKQAIRTWRDAGFPSVKRPGVKVEPATARQYASKCRTLEAWGGDVALSSITPERVGKLRDALMVPARTGRWKDQVRHHAAHETLRVGRTLFRWLEQQVHGAAWIQPVRGICPGGASAAAAMWWRRHAKRSSPPRPRIRRSSSRSTSRFRSASARRISCACSSTNMSRSRTTSSTMRYGSSSPSDAAGRRTVMGIRLRQNKGRTWVEVPVVGATTPAADRDQVARPKPPA